ncbi:unnamed protein product [Blepharisma stoltei]|uniref:RRM domain-containing protein n=1 Tax=Blepharisma stoltei TaxID=1481888 RepID=A0AAU9IRP3_9CILI|nr:unnamed protein product [Blepharisma stoltei]
MEEERSRSRSPDANDSGKNLYVTNISYSTRESDLEEAFSKFGKITQCKIVKDQKTNKSRGFGFVSFESIDNAEEAIKEMNNKTVDGRELRVEKAKRSSGHKSTPGKYASNGPRRSPYRDRDSERYRDRDRTNYRDRNSYRDRERDNYRENHRDNYRESYRDRERDNYRDKDEYRRENPRRSPKSDERSSPHRYR